MRHPLNILLAAGLAVFAAACGPSRRVAEATVDAATAKAMVAQGAQVLDVRQAHEYAAGHIEGAVLAPLDKMGASLDRLSKERPMVVYCRTGRRSARALELLLDTGFVRARQLDGGIQAWEDAGFSVVR